MSAEIVYGYLLTKSFIRAHWGAPKHGASFEASSDDSLHASTDESYHSSSDESADDEFDSTQWKTKLVYDRTMYRLYDIDFAYSTSPSPSTVHNEQEVFVIGFKLVSMKYQYSGVMAVPKDPPPAVLDKLRHDNPALARLTPQVYVVCDGGS